MKSVTEFASYALVEGIKAKTALASEGKTPEEIQASLGEKFKFEGDKLKYFVAALEVAAQNMENLSRVLVVTYAEGESAAPKAVKVEEMHYLPEFRVAARAVVTTKVDAKGGGRGKGGGQKGNSPKTSPWGLTPEEKAAKAAGKGGGKPKPA